MSSNPKILDVNDDDEQNGGPIPTVLLAVADPEQGFQEKPPEFELHQQRKTVAPCLARVEAALVVRFERLEHVGLAQRPDLAARRVRSARFEDAVDGPPGSFALPIAT